MTRELCSEFLGQDTSTAFSFAREKLQDALGNGQAFCNTPKHPAKKRDMPNIAIDIHHHYIPENTLDETRRRSVTQ
jgi:hypothetical protein